MTRGTWAVGILLSQVAELSSMTSWKVKTVLTVLLLGIRMAAHAAILLAYCDCVIWILCVHGNMLKCVYCIWSRNIVTQLGHQNGISGIYPTDTPPRGSKAIILSTEVLYYWGYWVRKSLWLLFTIRTYNLINFQCKFGLAEDKFRKNRENVSF